MKFSQEDIDVLLNDFAIRSFRDIADCDYIAARLSFRASLMPQFLWQGLQSLEKYFKCILVLNRIKAPKSHCLSDLLKSLEALSFQVQMSESTQTLINYLDTYGRFRYFETTYNANSDRLFQLDRAVWEVRRYARVLEVTLRMPNGDHRNLRARVLAQIESSEARPRQYPQHFGGHLERVVAKMNHASREGLIWHNLYFGKARRKSVRHKWRSVSANSPLAMRPALLDEVLKYVFLPRDVIDAFRDRQRTS